MLNNVLSSIIHIQFLINCLLAIGFGAIIGLEREFKQKPAGLKTHMLICLGSMTITYLSAKFSVSGDPNRIAAQIVSGIGFIGAGTILHSKQIVQGLTTAATLWVIASVGMLIGAGHILASLIVVVLVFLLLILSNALTRTSQQINSYCISLSLSRISALTEIEDMLDKFEITVDKKALRKDELLHLDMTYSAAPLANYFFLKRIYQMPGIGTVLKI
jgi:putative Mg2+ transporter-C (MgtC) family protein